MKPDVENKPKKARTLRAVLRAELGVGVQHLTNASIWPENLRLSFGSCLGLCSVSGVRAALWPKQALLLPAHIPPSPGERAGLSRVNTALEIAAKKLMFPC